MTYVRVPASVQRLLLAFALVACAPLLVRCDFVEPAEENRLVVEAFLQTGRTLPPITLRQTRALRNPADSTADAATGAQLSVLLNGQRVAYRPSDAQPGQYVPSEDVVVPARVPFTLDVRWEGEHAVADGTTPPPIAIDEVDISVPAEPVQAILVDSLRRDSLDIPAEQGYIYPIDVTVRWTIDFIEIGTDSTYWVRAQLKPTSRFSSRVVDFFLQPDEVRRERAFRGTANRRSWTGVYAVPVDGAEAPLPAHRLTAALVRGDAAFASFATSRTDPERREPVSNVDGGLGIATAVALDSCRFDVTSTPDAETSPCLPSDGAQDDL